MLRRRSGPVNALDLALELMYHGHRRLVEEPDRLLARRGLSRIHHRILYFVVRRDGFTMGDLLAALGVTKQAVHQPIRELVARDLIRVTPDGRDRRRRRLGISPNGRRFEGKLTGIQHRRLEALFKASGVVAERGWRKVMEGMALGESPSRSRAGHLAN